MATNALILLHNVKTFSTRKVTIKNKRQSEVANGIRTILMCAQSNH